jgi:arsenate reductase (thioredoxin)
MHECRVLILGTGDSARCLMAEGLLRDAGGDRFEVYSASTDPTDVHAEAIVVMAEIGINITARCSKSVEEFAGRHFDFVISVCDHAREFCPVFPGESKHVHWSLPDPVAGAGSDEERKALFRKVRDEMKHRIKAFVAEHGESSPR